MNLHSDVNECKSAPLNLTSGQISNPLWVLHDFFDDDCLSGQLDMLTQWRTCVLTNDYYRGAKNSPAELWHFYRLNLCLIEAMYLLWQATAEPAKEKKANQTNAAELQTEQALWGEYPRNLSDAELLDPYWVVTQFFESGTLPEYRDMLEEWLEHGLASKAANEFIDAIDLIRLYESLGRLYAAAWLIYQRTSDKPFPNRTKKKGKHLPEAKASGILDTLFTLTQTDNSMEITLYQPNRVISSPLQLQLAKIVSTVRHKLPLVQVVIYLGRPPVEEPVSDAILFLLVIMSDTEQRKATELAGMLEDSCKVHAGTAIIVRQAAIFMDSLDDPASLYSRALACPKVYLSGELLLPDATSKLSDGVSEKMITRWKRWHTQAQDFLHGAEYYLQAGAVNAALFSLHQAAECILVAVLRTIAGYNPGTHNVFTMLKLTQLFTPDLTAVFRLGTEDGERQFSTLKDAYFQVRYKDNFEADAEIVQALLVDVRQCMGVAEQLYNRYMLSNNI